MCACVCMCVCVHDLWIEGVDVIGSNSSCIIEIDVSGCILCGETDTGLKISMMHEEFEPIIKKSMITIIKIYSLNAFRFLMTS